MVLLQHAAVGLHVVPRALLLRELTHLHLGEVALDRLADELLAGGVLGEAAGGGEGQGRGKADGCKKPVHKAVPRRLAGRDAAATGVNGGPE